MTRSPVLVVDADVIVAEASFEDSLHKKVLQLLQSFKQVDARLIYPASVVIEAVTHLQRVLGNKRLAYDVAQRFTDPDLEVVAVSQNLMAQAISVFSPVTSKKNTLFDCLVVAVAEKYQADAIFSFDKFYKTKGFRLASEL